MSVDINNDVKDIRFRTVTLSLRVDAGCTEGLIKTVLNHWSKGIKGSAYILHDKDSYTEKEVKDINKRLDNDIQALKDANVWTQEKEDELQAKKVAVGEHKPDHWHILLDFGTNPKSVSAIATMFHTIPSMVNKVMGGKKGFASFLAYLTHITPTAMNDGKFEYDTSEVKGLKFPETGEYDGFSTYEDFANAYLEGTFITDVTAKDVLQGRITPDELMVKDPDYFLKHETMIRRARVNYNNSKPTPTSLFNFFVGTGSSDREGSQGRIGKGIMCKALALSYLANMFPNIDFTAMTEDQLKKKGYIYWAGGAGVPFQGYDGQPIVIWEDCRAFDLIKAFGGINNVFKALDTHPKPIGLNIKYGEVYLKNSIFIFDGAQTYEQFIDELTTKWVQDMDSSGDIHNVMKVNEDQSQAKGRFPFILEITPSTISATVQLEYLIGTTKYNSRKTFTNDLRFLAQAKKLEVASNTIGKQFVDASANALSILDEPKDEPDNLLEEISEDEANRLKELDGVRTSSSLADVRKISDENEYREYRRETSINLKNQLGITMEWVDD